MNAAAYTEEQPITLYRLATQAIIKSKGDADKATDKLVNDLMSDLPLTTELVKNAIAVAVIQYNQTMIGHRRDAIAVAAERRIENGEIPMERKPTTGMTRQQAVNFAAVVANCLMDWPLVGNIRMKDATASDLDFSASTYEKNSQTQALRARWLRMIQKKLPKNKKVGQALTEADLQALYQEAQNVR